MHFIHFLTCCIFLMAVCMHLAKCQTCGPRVSPRLLREIPCDLNAVPYCTLPGSAYPWSSLRRYIYENQGFVKRMYGEQRQSQLVHEEMTRLNEYYDVEWREARVMTSNNTSTSGESVTGLPLDSQSKGETVDNATMTPLSNDINDEMVSLSTTDANLNDSGDNVESTTTTSAINHESGSNTVPLETRATSVPTPKGFNACPITQEVVAPYWANNTRGETLALLNVYPFEQYIHWEKCAFEGEQMYCREGCRCEQQYRLHRLLAFDPKNECRGIFADWFRFPGCCVCICYDNQARINNRKSRL